MKGDLRDAERQCGFTLIELLLALSISGVVVVVIFGALRITVRAWEKGEGRVALQQRSRTVLDQLDRQLSSAVVLFADREDQPLVAFTGTERSLEFASALPLATEPRFAPVHVTYAIESGPDGKVKLLLHESAISPADYAADHPLLHHRAGAVLSDGLEELRFEYLGDAGAGSGLAWASSWQADAAAPLPRAVRISLRTEAGGPIVRVIARVNLWERFRPDAP